MKHYLQFIAGLVSCFVVFTFVALIVPAQEKGHESPVIVREPCSPDGCLFVLHENADTGYWIIDKHSQKEL